MENLVRDLVEKKGLLIGLGAGVLRVIQCIHNGHFKPLKAILNLVSSSIMGYFTWEIGMMLEANLTVVIIATVIASFNAFLTIETLTDRTLITRIVRNWFEKRVNK